MEGEIVTAEQAFERQLLASKPLSEEYFNYTDDELRAITPAYKYQYGEEFERFKQSRLKTSLDTTIAPGDILLYALEYRTRFTYSDSSGKHYEVRAELARFVARELDQINEKYKIINGALPSLFLKDNNAQLLEQ